MNLGDIGEDFEVGVEEDQDDGEDHTTNKDEHDGLEKNREPV